MSDPPQGSTPQRGGPYHDRIRLRRSCYGDYPVDLDRVVLGLRGANIKKTFEREAAELGLEKSVEQPRKSSLRDRGSRSDVLISRRGKIHLARKDARSLGLAREQTMTTLCLFKLINLGNMESKFSDSNPFFYLHSYIKPTFVPKYRQSFLLLLFLTNKNEIKFKEKNSSCVNNK